MPGGLVPLATYDELSKGRKAATAAYLRTDRNRWFYATAASTVVSMLLAFGWYQADRRYAENVRVAWVKLSPDGTYAVEYTEDEKPVQFFEATIESKLAEFIEKRFSRRRETISTDYGFARLMMSPQLQTEFMDAFKAASVAAEHVGCANCNQIEMRVREIQSIDKDIAPGSQRRRQYTSLVFATEIAKNREGMVMACANKIITLLWTFRPKEEIVNRREELRYNPLGQEIVRADMRDDPTPATAAGCRR